MKFVNIMLTALALSGAATSAHADPALLLGGTLRFGAGEPAFGVTAKIISDNDPDRFVAGVGLSWFPGAAQPIGLDGSVGYLTEDAAAMVGYDVLTRGGVFSLGYVNTVEDEDEAPPPPVMNFT